MFADEQPATELAERLLRSIHQTVQEPDTRIHKSPWPNWYATQEVASVAICNKETDEKV